MRRGLVWALGVTFLAVLSAPAFAGDSGGLSHENVDITKCIYIGVKQLKQVDQSAEATAVKQDWSQDNHVTETPEIIPGNQVIEAPDVIHPVTPVALIHDSVFNGFNGIITINQSPGEINNQGNAVSTAFSMSGETFLHARAEAVKIQGEKWCDQSGDFVGEGNTVDACFTPRSNLITNCLQEVHGIVGINQSAGNINNQNNAVAMAVSDKPVACLAEAELDLISGGNCVTQLATIKTDTLEGSIFTGTGSSGIVGINQATGNICNQANVIASCLVQPF